MSSHPASISDLQVDQRLAYKSGDDLLQVAVKAVHESTVDVAEVDGSDTTYADVTVSSLYLPFQNGKFDSLPALKPGMVVHSLFRVAGENTTVYYEASVVRGGENSVTLQFDADSEDDFEPAQMHPYDDVVVLDPSNVSVNTDRIERAKKAKAAAAKAAAAARAEEEEEEDDEEEEEEEDERAARQAKPAAGAGDDSDYDSDPTASKRKRTPTRTSSRKSHRFDDESDSDF